MAKIVTFRTAWPADKDGKAMPTNFRQLLEVAYSRMYKQFYLQGEAAYGRPYAKWPWLDDESIAPKWHTIRRSNYIKDTDWISCRSWQGKPRQKGSRLVELIPNIPVNVVVPITYSLKGNWLQVADYTYPLFDDLKLGFCSIPFSRLTTNDGITINQFFDLFEPEEPYNLICWHPNPKELPYFQPSKGVLHTPDDTPLKSPNPTN